MATKIFDVAKMVSEDVLAYDRSAKFCTGNDDAPVYAQCDDGAFVTLGGLCDDATYDGMKDYNCKKAFAPTAANLTVDKVWVIDLADVSEGIIAGNTYRIGAKLVEMKGEAGSAVRVRKVCKFDRFWLGAGCFESLPTVGQFATLTANKVTLTPNASEQDSKVNFAIRASKPMTIGTLVPGAPAYEQEYLVEVL